MWANLEEGTSADEPVRQVQIHNDNVIKYMINSDFQRWFRPIVVRLGLGIALSPAVVIVLYFTHLLTPAMSIAVNYLRLFRVFLTAQAPPGFENVVNLLNNICPPLYILVGLAIAFFTIKMLNEPDSILITKDGLLFAKISSVDKSYTVVNIVNRLSWKDVQNIRVGRPTQTRSNRDYYFEIDRPLLGTIKLRFGDIIRADDRQLFLNTLKERFPQWVDDEAVAAMSPPSERQSYTELWLAELSAPPKRDRLTPLEVGARIFEKKYEILSKLGVGGQGTVYLASTTGSNNQDDVVLKEFVLPIFPDQNVRKSAAIRFQKEADLLTKLDHPQIVKLLDLFIEDHRAYLVLEHLSGQNLKDLVAAQGRLPKVEIYRLARQMCEILVYLHGQEPPVVHRDFTPDNLILDLDGKLKLIDFSVAQNFTSNVTGSVVGKPHYIAPEQFRGKPTAQSDIYSMGATLYYLATAREPEPITNLRLQEADEKADSRLALLIEKATKLDVGARYHSAAEMLAQIAET